MIIKLCVARTIKAMMQVINRSYTGFRLGYGGLIVGEGLNS